jgi:hypothetical protein
MAVKNYAHISDSLSMVTEQNPKQDKVLIFWDVADFVIDISFSSRILANPQSKR